MNEAKEIGFIDLELEDGSLIRVPVVEVQEDGEE